MKSFGSWGGRPPKDGEVEKLSSAGNVIPQMAFFGVIGVVLAVSEGIQALKYRWGLWKLKHL